MAQLSQQEHASRTQSVKSSEKKIIIHLYQTLNGPRSRIQYIDVKTIYASSEERKLMNDLHKHSDLQG